MHLESIKLHKTVSTTYLMKYDIHLRALITSTPSFAANHFKSLQRLPEHKEPIHGSASHPNKQKITSLPNPTSFKILPINSHIPLLFPLYSYLSDPRIFRLYALPHHAPHCQAHKILISTTSTSGCKSQLHHPISPTQWPNSMMYCSLHTTGPS